MSYRKLISALVFAAFGFCFSGEATAQTCDNPDFCFDFGIPVTVDNITGSSIKCELQPGGASEPFNNLAIDNPTTTTWPITPGTATFTQTGTATCKHDDANLGICAFELTWTGVSISSCTNNKFTATAFCEDIIGDVDNPATVTGTITCPPPPAPPGIVPLVVNLGIRISNTDKTCADVFSKLVDDNTIPPTLILPAGQVLDLTVTTKGVPSECKGPFVAISDLKERYCNGGFDTSPIPLSIPGGPVDCTPEVGPTRKTTDATTVNPLAVTFDFDVRETVNRKCQGNKQGNVNIDILGSVFFDVANVDTSSLACGGSLEPEDLATLSHCMIQDKNHDGFPDLACKADACPKFAPGLVASDGIATAVCTGNLKPVGTGPGTAIHGTDDNVKVNH